MKKLFLATATLLTLAGGTYTVLANNTNNNGTKLEDSYEYNRDYGSHFNDETRPSNIQEEKTNYRRQESSNENYPNHHNYQKNHHRSWNGNKNNGWGRKPERNSYNQGTNNYSNQKRHHRSNGHCDF